MGEYTKVSVNDQPDAEPKDESREQDRWSWRDGGIKVSGRLTPDPKHKRRSILKGY